LQSEREAGIFLAQKRRSIFSKESDANNRGASSAKACPGCFGLEESAQRGDNGFVV
jgi:hypothetical protein